MAVNDDELEPGEVDDEIDDDDLAGDEDDDLDDSVALEDEDDEDDESSLEELLAQRAAARRGGGEDDDEEETLVALSDEPEILAPVEPLSRIIPIKDRKEFVCRRCFLVKARSQLADAERQLCRDCV